MCTQMYCLILTSFVPSFNPAILLLKLCKAQCNGIRNVILTDIACSAHSNSHLSMYMPVYSVLQKAAMNLTLVQLLPVCLRESWIEPDAQGLEMYCMMSLMKRNCMFILVLYECVIISELTICHATGDKEHPAAKAASGLDHNSSR